jgi:PIN domain nuclease of toxin-antitoxin system
MQLLLDTAVFLWLIAGDDRLSEPTRSAIRDPENRVWLSAVSLWEISVKQKTGRLVLPDPAWSYVVDARKRHAIESLALDESAVAHLSKLPDVHRDPFDRMLICQSIEHDLLLVTNDPAIQAYPVKTMWS